MIKATSPVALDALLRSDSALARLLRTKPVSLNGNTLTLPGLPTALADKVSLSMADGELLLTVPNNAVAQILRFHAPRLTREAGASSFKIRVSPSDRGLPEKQVDTTLLPSLTQASATVLEQAASDCDYEPLAQALRRLAALADTPDK